MTIHAIDHVTLRTDQLEQTIAFYRDAIGLQEGGGPPFLFRVAGSTQEGAPCCTSLPTPRARD
ncbi:VOC family protein [Aeromonas dhakensis]